MYLRGSFIRRVSGEGVNQAVYWLLVLTVALLALWGGAVDLGLWWHGDDTISHLLRRHPWMFWVPAFVSMIFWLTLGLHLYVIT